MGRTVIVGDLHACRDELVALLARVGLGDGDQLVMVGDLVVRGPDPAGAIDLLIQHGARSARGNHDDRLLRWRRGQGKSLGDAHRITAQALRERHWDYLASLPLWLDVDARLRVVHAGLVPGVPMEKQDPRALMYMRCLSAAGEPVDQRGDRLWGRYYTGPPHVVFGHNAMSDPQLHAWATGLDTGAVYGGRLTAMVLAEGATPPPPAERGDVLVSVPARRRYADT